MSRTITGGIIIIIGLGLMVVSFFKSFAFLIYSTIILIMGIIIFLNKNEDKIERIKKIGGKK
ncbi:MAG TPA: hypothetical protein ENI61_03010 [Ignavibacteria bacterium]|nr:hypothetical protein [Ignavibacteria bacterium]